MTLYTFAPVQPPQCLPQCIRPLGAGVRLLLTLALALGTVACGPEATPGNGSMNGNGNGNANGGNGNGNGNGNGAMDIAVAAGVTDVTPMGFTLTLQPGVPGIAPQDLTLKPAVAIATATANTDDMPNTRYTVKTEALLALSQEYMLTITKAGYAMTSPTFMRSTASSEATIQKMTLTVEGVEVEGTINGTDITFPNAPKGDSVSLAGTVSLVLAEGAEVIDAPSPHGLKKTYTTASTALKVQAEDGVTTKTYNISVAGYDATSNLYGVYTAAQLHAVREGLSDGYRLMQDLALPDAVNDCTKPDWAEAADNYCTNGWKPIGTSGTEFTGTFDGNGHRISNFFIQRSGTDDVGLFGYTTSSAAIRNLGVASVGVTGRRRVGGLVGNMDGGTLTNAYAVGTVSGGESVGGLVGRLDGGTVSNAYATGAVLGGSGDKVGGLVGGSSGSVSNCYATGAVNGSGTDVGGLLGNKGSSGAVTNSYYPTGRPTGAAGEALNSGAGQNDFTGFTFDNNASTGWKWVDGKWPQLNGFEAAQATPSLSYHKAALSATPVPDSSGFTMTLTPPLSGSTQDDWALYNSATGAVVRLTNVSPENAGAKYAFQASLVMGTSYRLLYTKADVIVVPETAGHITIEVLRNSTTVEGMTLTLHNVAVPAAITHGAANEVGTIIFPNAPKGDSVSLTGTVALVLAEGAEVVGAPSPHTLVKTYTTASTALRVQAEDGMTTKTYNISVAAYNATSNPYGVYTAAHLHAVRNGLTANYRLMQDVTLPNAGSGCSKPSWVPTDYCEKGWEPIGTYSPADSRFTGTFDGNGHSISNLFIKRSSTNYVGLFGYAGTGGTIRDLGVHIAATGVTGGDNVGGLVGFNGGAITNCYATGAVSGNDGVGGLAGGSRGPITNCYATGAVTGSGSVGGLVGATDSTVSNSYATGAVSGSSQVGGLVGHTDGGTVTNSYATGAVSGSTNVGGLLGRKGSRGTVTNSYYPTGRPTGAGGAAMSAGAVRTDFTDFNFDSNANTGWKWVAGKWPQLNGFEAAQATPSLLNYHTATVTANSVSTTAFTMTLSPSLSGLTKADWALYGSSGAVTLASVVDTGSGGGYTFTTTTTMAAGTYRLLYTKADVIVVPETAGHITIEVLRNSTTVEGMTLTVDSVVVPAAITHGAANEVGTIIFPNAPKGDSVSLRGTVALVLAGGAEVVGTNPNGPGKIYTTAATALQVRAEDGMTTKTYNISVAAYNATSNPYGVYTAAHLHAVRDGLTANYRLMQDLALPNAGSSCRSEPFSAQSDYCKKGWEPIGTYGTEFTGTFDGNGHSISNLFIGRSGTSGVGLFGYVGRGGTIRNLGVHIVAAGVNGNDGVGGLVGGNNKGTITNCYATGAVTGSGNAVGGLVGSNNGTITNCYATGAVTGSNEVGGLAGGCEGIVSNSYATGAVSGRNYVGGLAGGADGGTVSNSYATGAVSGRDGVGGLMGRSGGTITNCYATGAVSGSTNVGGLMGNKHSGGTVTNSYYPSGRPVTAGGEAMSARAGQGAFKSFNFDSNANTGWKWVVGKWPQLNGFEAAQATPSLLAYHTATVTGGSISTTKFTITLAPSLSGLTKADWALYGSSGAVPLTTVADTGTGGGYTFTPTTAMTAGNTYRLLYTKADVIVVPSSPGHISFTVPGG